MCASYSLHDWVLTSTCAWCGKLCSQTDFCVPKSMQRFPWQNHSCFQCSATRGHPMLIFSLVPCTLLVMKYLYNFTLSNIMNVLVDTVVCRLASLLPSFILPLKDAPFSSKSWYWLLLSDLSNSDDLFVQLSTVFFLVPLVFPAFCCWLPVYLYMLLQSNSKWANSFSQSGTVSQFKHLKCFLCSVANKIWLHEIYLILISVFIYCFSGIGSGISLYVLFILLIYSSY